MKIVSAKEQIELEKRIAITPETAKKFISIGIDVSLLQANVDVLYF